jgi:1,4-alpha-glucan branching enzyme
VWAPHAEAVAITGIFNNQGESTYPMLKEDETGCWTIKIPQARPGDVYKYNLIYRGQSLLRLDPYARDVEPNNNYAIIPQDDFVWGNTHFQMPSWNRLVLYEMHIASFNRSSLAGQGDFYSAVEKLGHLRELGINAVEVMPVTQCGFSWGYSPYALFAIKTEYGGSQGFKEFVRAAHAQGIAVIVDVVYNHMSSRTDKNLLWQFDGWGQNSGGIYFYPDQRSWSEWGPRLNFNEAAVRQMIADNVQMWLDEFQCDGLRWDATAFIRRYQPAKDKPMLDLPEGWELMREIIGDVHARWPDKLMIAEDLQSDAYRLTQTITEGGAGFDSQWDAGFLHVVREVLAQPNDAERDMGTLQWAITNRYAPDMTRRVVYTESHDDVADRHGKLRLARLLRRSRPAAPETPSLALLAAALTLTTPGIPMLFQGQELLEDESFSADATLDWDKAQANAAFLGCLSQLTRLRTNESQTTRGLSGQAVNVFHVNHADKVIAFHRWDNGGARDDTVVVLNLSAQSFHSYILGLPRPGSWVVRLNSAACLAPASAFKTREVQVDTTLGEKDGLRQWGDLHLPPYSVLILSQD